MDSLAAGPTRAVPTAREEGRAAAAHREHRARTELLVGAVLVLAVAVVGVVFAFRPSPVFIDRWVLDLVGPSGNGALTRVTVLRYPAVIVVASALVAAVAFPTDRLRSLACLVGPPLALLTCELVLKPLVGRHLGGGLSYPSGSTVGAAALATAAALAVPARWRTATIVVGVAYSVWMAVAVVALQWHLPTDAVAGLAYGTGVVLVMDGALAVGGRALVARPTRKHGTASGGG